MDSSFESQSLNSALIAVGARPSDQLFEALRIAYAEPGRHYHTSVHVAECLRHLTRYQHLAACLPEIELAIWFHDAIYDTHAKDNEERSAAWAQRELSALGAPANSIERVNEMILATKTHLSGHPDTVLMVDIDLGILGTPPTVFERYDEAIRREYSWVSQADYRAGRAKVLASFLERPLIFKTLEIQREYEFQARENLHRKISESTS